MTKKKYFFFECFHKVGEGVSSNSLIFHFPSILCKNSYLFSLLNSKYPRGTDLGFQMKWKNRCAQIAHFRRKIIVPPQDRIFTFFPRKKCIFFAKFLVNLLRAIMPPPPIIAAVFTTRPIISSYMKMNNLNQAQK